jgi:hypothetical protein
MSRIENDEAPAFAAELRRGMRMTKEDLNNETNLDHPVSTFGLRPCFGIRHSSFK